MVFLLLIFLVTASLPGIQGGGSVPSSPTSDEDSSPSFSLRTKGHLHELFRSDANQKFETDEIYANEIQNFMNKVQHQDPTAEEEKHFFLLQYSPDHCRPASEQELQQGTCHEVMRQRFHERMVPYEIVNSDHALVRIEFSSLQSFVNDLPPNFLLDSVPLLPQLKIDEDLNLEKVCPNLLEILNLHMVWVPSNEADLLALQQAISSHPELFPENYIFPTNELPSLATPLAPAAAAHQISVPLKCQFGEDGLSLFSSLSSIRWIELRPVIRSLSYWANGITQSGEPTVNLLAEAGLGNRSSHWHCGHRTRCQLLLFPRP
jgi:hypothetical protein